MTQFTIWKLSLHGDYNISLITCVTAMLLNFHCWFNFPLSLVPQIVSKYDDGGSKSRASANVTAVMSAKQHQRSALIDELKHAAGEAVRLPRALQQDPPDHWLLADSGANIHVLFGKR